MATIEDLDKFEYHASTFTDQVAKYQSIQAIKQLRSKPPEGFDTWSRSDLINIVTNMSLQMPKAPKHGTPLGLLGMAADLPGAAVETLYRGAVEGEGLPAGAKGAFKAWTGKEKYRSPETLRLAADIGAFAAIPLGWIGKGKRLGKLKKSVAEQTAAARNIRRIKATTAGAPGKVVGTPLNPMEQFRYNAARAAGEKGVLDDIVRAADRRRTARGLGEKVGGWPLSRAGVKDVVKKSVTPAKGRRAAYEQAAYEEQVAARIAEGKTVAQARAAKAGTEKKIAGFKEKSFAEYDKYYRGIPKGLRTKADEDLRELMLRKFMREKTLKAHRTRAKIAADKVILETNLAAKKAATQAKRKKVVKGEKLEVIPVEKKIVHPESEEAAFGITAGESSRYKGTRNFHAAMQQLGIPKNKRNLIYDNLMLSEEKGLGNYFHTKGGNITEWGENIATRIANAADDEIRTVWAPRAKEYVASTKLVKKTVKRKGGGQKPRERSKKEIAQKQETRTRRTQKGKDLEEGLRLMWKDKLTKGEAKRLQSISEAYPRAEFGTNVLAKHELVAEIGKAMKKQNVYIVKTKEGYTSKTLLSEFREPARRGEKVRTVDEVVSEKMVSLKSKRYSMDELRRHRDILEKWEKEKLFKKGHDLETKRIKKHGQSVLKTRGSREVKPPGGWPKGWTKKQKGDWQREIKNITADDKKRAQIKRRINREK